MKQSPRLFVLGAIFCIILLVLISIRLLDRTALEANNTDVLSVLLLCTALVLLNQILQNRQKTEDGLRAARDDLERRVQERTEQLEKTSRRWAFIAEAGRLLALSNNYAVAIQSIADLIVPQLADWCFILFDTTDYSEPAVAAAHKDPVKAEVVRTLGKHYPPDQVSAISSLTSKITTLTPEASQALLMMDAHMLKDLTIQSVIVVPISINEGRIGTIVLVQGAEDRHFESADLWMAEDLASRIASAVSKARLLQDAQRARQIAEQNAGWIARYQKVISVLTETHSVQQATQVIIDQGISAMGAVAGSVAMLTENNRMLEIVGSTGYSPDVVATWKSFPIDSPSLIAYAIRTRQPVWIKSIDEAKEMQVSVFSRDLAGHSWAAIPLYMHGNVVGGMSLSFDRPQTFTEDDKAFIISLTQKCSQALERSQLHNEILEQREQLQVTLASIGDAVIATDARGFITFINQIALDLTEWTREEAISTPLSTVFRIINESTREPEESPHLQVMRSGNVVGLANHTQLITKHGREIPIDDSGAPIRDPSGTVNGAVIVFRDITKRRHQELELENLLQRTQDLYEICYQIGLAYSPIEILRALLASRYLKHATQAGIINFDSNWRLTRPVHIEVAAVLNPDLPLTGFSDLKTASDCALLSMFSANTPTFINDITSDAHLSPEVRSVCLQNKIHSLMMYPLEAHSNCFGVLVIYFDKPNPWIVQDSRHIQTFIEQICVSLDNLRLLEDEKRARQAAEVADQLKLKFLAMISHELRTPLTSIKGFATTLLATDVTWDEHDQREFLTIINDEANKLTDLIEQLLDLSRIQAGTLRINVEARTVDDILNIARPQLEALTPNHTLRIAAADRLPILNVDAQRVAQVLVNLVGNATKYSPKGTEIQLSFTRQDNTIRVSITDQGSGILPENRQKIFEPFWQLHSTNTQEDGVGLGLAICKGLIEAHGGKIWIEDTPDPGTTISFTLPC